MSLVPLSLEADLAGSVRDLADEIRSEVRGSVRDLKAELKAAAREVRIEALSRARTAPPPPAPPPPRGERDLEDWITRMLAEATAGATGRAVEDVRRILTDPGDETPPDLAPPLRGTS